MTAGILYSKKSMSSIAYTIFVLSVIVLINGIPFDAENRNLEEQQILPRGVITCGVWYLSQPDPQTLLAKTLTPKCTIDPSFPPTLPGGWSVDTGCDASKQPNTCDLHKGAYGCYRSALGTTGPGAQACYDKNGHFISDPWKGAGTLDAESPTGGVIQSAKHFLTDVAPYYSCCKVTFFQEYNCNHYYEKRPPGSCKD